MAGELVVASESLLSSLMAPGPMASRMLLVGCRWRQEEHGRRRCRVRQHW